MSNLTQRKYNICGALERITKGEQFAFSNYLTETEIDKFQDYKKTFKYMGNFTDENRIAHKNDTEFFIESMLMDKKAPIKMLFFPVKPALNGSRAFISHAYTLPANEKVAFSKEDEETFENKIPKEIMELLLQLESDLYFCSGVKAISYPTFSLSGGNAQYWHTDNSYASHVVIRSAIVPFGTHTIYTNASVKEAKSLYELDNISSHKDNVYIASPQQISFHVLKKCLYGTKYHSLETNPDGDCIHEEGFEGATHSSPVDSAERLYIKLSDHSSSLRDSYKGFTPLANHLDYLKKELIEAYNIPDHEFNWDNVSSYENESLHTSALDGATEECMSDIYV